VSGVVYDSTNCTEHLIGCQGLVGARVTVTYANDPANTVPGTIITGPDGFFAFPLPGTHIYWLRVEKDVYTYGQREVEVVGEHSTATDEIYLTPLDPAITYCDDAGCSHTSSVVCWRWRFRLARLHPARSWRLPPPISATSSSCPMEIVCRQVCMNIGQRFPIEGDESVIAWIGRDIAHAMPESLARDWPPLLGNIPVGNQPTDIVLSPDETRAYAANSGNNTLSVIDLSLQQEIYTIPVGSAPQGMTLSSNGLFACVINRMADTVSVVDLTAQQVVTTISVGSSPHSIALSPDEAFGYVTNSEERTLSVLDLQTYQEIERINVGRGPEDVTISPDGAFA
jgi:YVTN family beta-propeller protein